jgi:Zn-dependent protease with chaperone function
VNFFDAQEKALRSTRWLVVVYVIATILIVVGVTLVIGAAMYLLDDASNYVSVYDYLGNYSGPFIGVAVVTAVFILGATVFKASMLSSGGGRVASDLGGTLVPPDTSDPLRRRLRNVVEEMAIASGVPVPEIYVLESESGINAFAAGHSPGDAAIAVTRGALEMLDRDELQGVIGHEFSHILNGDMRLNIRMMGVLFGIMAIALIGRTILRGARHARGRGAAPVLVLGGGLMAVGGIGIVLARLIKAGVSRQREYLADASAVQFTRQTNGIANALKKIGGLGAKSYLTAADPEEVNHMLFGSGSRLSGLFATHPPLTERIQALDPGFDPSDYPHVNDRTRRAVEQSAATDAGPVSAMAAASAAPAPKSIADLVGETRGEHVAYAAAIRESVPVALYEAAHSTEMAYFLSIALVLARHAPTAALQFAVIEQQLGPERAQMIRRLHTALADTGREYRLPLLGIAFPALKRRPVPQLAYLVELVGNLIDVDGEIDLYEFCYYRILTTQVDRATHPSRRRPLRRVSKGPVRDAAVNLLRVVAHFGHAEDDARAGAFRKGMALFGAWGQAYDYDPARSYSTTDLDQALELLVALHGKGRALLLDAVTEVVKSDARLTVAEAELIRAICASLDCPLPPILVEKSAD